MLPADRIRCFGVGGRSELPSTVLANPGSRAGSGWAHLGPQGLLSAPVCPGCELLVPEGRYGEGVRPTDRPRLLDARNSYSRAPPTPLFPFGGPPGAAAAADRREAAAAPAGPALQGASQKRSGNELPSSSTQLVCTAVSTRTEERRPSGPWGKFLPHQVAKAQLLTPSR